MSMTKIATVTVGSGGASSIDFTSIPGTFTDIVIVLSLRSTRTSAADDPVKIEINGSATGFTTRELLGLGSSAESNTRTNRLYYSDSNAATANTFSNATVYIPNYAGSTNKSYSVDGVSENNATAAIQDIAAGIWANTAAITSLKFVSDTASNFVQYSTATLYGITKGSLAGVTVS